MATSRKYFSFVWLVFCLILFIDLKFMYTKIKFVVYFSRISKRCNSKAVLTNFTAPIMVIDRIHFWIINLVGASGCLRMH